MMEWFQNLSRPIKFGIFVGTAGLCASTGALAYHYYSTSKNTCTNVRNSAKENCLSDTPLKVTEGNSTLGGDDIDSTSLNPTDDLMMSTEDTGNIIQRNSNQNGFIKDKVAVENDSIDDGFLEKKQTRKVVLLGLESCGKSALLAELSKEGNHHIEYQPTRGFNVVCISFDHCDLSIWEVGGGEDYRLYWRNFCNSTDLILFAVDACDRGKFPLVKKYFFDIIQEMQEEIEIRVVATKCDRVDAISDTELQQAIGVDGVDWDIIRIAVISGGATENFGIEEIQQLCLMS